MKKHNQGSGGKRKGENDNSTVDPSRDLDDMSNINYPDMDFEGDNFTGDIGVLRNNMS